MTWLVRVAPNRYADSVRLMGVARDVREQPGVEACEIVMGTAANLEALAALGARVEAGPGDLVIAVRAAQDAGEEALDAAELSLTAAPGELSRGADEPEPRSLPSAADRLAGANLALISVAGEYATLAAHQALTRGLDVFIFSDHVAVADERELKLRAERHERLMMGPGCGTAMLAGIGLGFSNVVRRGPVGIVAAAGTGAQEAACLLDAAGAGVSEIVGVGGRDLSAEVGGIMFRAGMRRLAEDDETETLLLVSKPPAPEVVRGLAGAAPRDKRVVGAFVGAGEEGEDLPFELHSTIEAGALAAAGAQAPDPAPLEDAVDERRTAGAGRTVLGLFCGGTLAHEATTILEHALGPVAGNVGHGGGELDGRHAVLDLGEEEYTRGRPHPMVDPDLRLRLLDEAAAGDRIGCVLLDVVLGHGGHPDPAGALAPAVARHARRADVV
jgi:FdrA protein